MDNEEDPNEELVIQLIEASSAEYSNNGDMLYPQGIESAYMGPY